MPDHDGEVSSPVERALLRHLHDVLMDGDQARLGCKQCEQGMRLLRALASIPEVTHRA